jgi:hypothetical protein
MTVNSRPLYRLSYRGVLSEILLLAAYCREIKRWRIDIIASEHVYESILNHKSIWFFYAAERFVLDCAHRFYCFGYILRGQHAGQA